MENTSMLEYKPTKEDFTFVQKDVKIKDLDFQTKPVSSFRDALRRFIRNKASVAAAIILGFLMLMAIFAPILMTNGKYKANSTLNYLPPRSIFSSGKKYIPEVPESELGKKDYPKGTYEIVKGSEKVINGVTFVNIYRDEYKFRFGKRTIEKVTEEEYQDLLKRKVTILEVKKNKVEVPGQPDLELYDYDITLEHYYEYFGFKSIPRFIFGTDSLGGDLFVKCWRGLRISLLIGVIVAAINLSIGILWGSISGYYGGKVDIIMERIVEIISGVPWIVVMSIAVILMGRNIGTIIFSIVLTSWIGTAGIVRAQFYRYKGQEYVLAARTLGAKDWRIMVKHILPNAIGPVVTSAVLVIPSAIFIEANLSYLGLGLEELDSLGIILANGQKILVDYPHLTVFPALIISLLMISFNLFGNGLRDAFNPTLRGIE